jgi:hypothetical protein
MDNNKKISTRQLTKWFCLVIYDMLLISLLIGLNFDEFGFVVAGVALINIVLLLHILEPGGKR